LNIKTEETEKKNTENSIKRKEDEEIEEDIVRFDDMDTYGSLIDYDLSPHIAGKGKYSVVYEARRKDDGRVCALKRINKDCLRTSQAKSRVVKEIRLLKSLDHINIVKHRKYFLENDELYIELEWADGGDLRSVIKKYEKRGKHLKENDVWHYFTQVARAVRHMHERRVMHRDLKPANIFLTKNGIVKVGDLGLGRELSENSHEAHSRVGTPLYMAPQILKGEGYDWKSDIWSMGCILYELARLQSPFRTGMRPHTELIKLMEHVIRGVYPPIPDSLNYSKDLKDLVMIMLAFDPSQRPTAAEVCLSAESILQNRRALAIAHNDSLSLQQQQQYLTQRSLLISSTNGNNNPNSGSISPPLGSFRLSSSVLNTVHEGDESPKSSRDFLSIRMGESNASHGLISRSNSPLAATATALSSTPNSIHIESSSSSPSKLSEFSSVNTDKPNAGTDIGNQVSNNTNKSKGRPTLSVITKDSSLFTSSSSPMSSPVSISDSSTNREGSAGDNISPNHTHSWGINFEW